MADLWPLLGLAFALGLSHGADPDHLTAIDGLTRASVERHPYLSRWVGTWFAVGHAVSVLSVAALIAVVARQLGEISASVRQFGWLVSALLLFAIGTINLVIFIKSRAQEAPGVSPSSTPWFFPGWWLRVTHPLAAVPVGALLGLGFETASQISAWALAGTVGHGYAGALLIASAFSAGMLVTDTVNGLMVRRLYLTAAQTARQSGRLMTLVVIGLAYGIGVVKLLQQTSFGPPVSDLGLTLVVLGTVLLAFTAAMVQAKRPVFH